MGIKERLLLVAVWGANALVVAQTNTFPSSGNVGIGTTSPSNPLTIKSTNTYQLNLIRNYDVTQGSSAASVIQMGALNGSTETVGSEIWGALNMSSAAGFLSFYTRNSNTLSERMRIDSLGNVGIGITSPTNKLDVNGTISFNTSLRANNLSNKLILNTSSSGGTEIHSASSTGIIFKDNSNNEKMRMDNSGNFGIGTSSPGQLLDVSGVQVWSNSGTQMAYLNPAANGVDFSLKNATSTTIRLDARPNGNVYFNSGGKVGIGTASPSYNLDVKGSTSYQLRVSSNDASATNNSGVSIYNASSATASSRRAMLLLDPNGANNIGTDYTYLDMYGSGNARLFNTFPSGSLQFGTAGIARISIDSAGNVGIGTTTPLAKLSVDGDIRTNEVKVMADISVPDYVFADDYELRTLQETKEYIQQNKHLPEIPSAEEIGEDGFSLGEMNMRLLKKVEELTLYQIQLLEIIGEQKKTLEEEKQKNEEQEKRIKQIENLIK